MKSKLQASMVRGRIPFGGEDIKIELEAKSQGSDDEPRNDPESAEEPKQMEPNMAKSPAKYSQGSESNLSTPDNKYIPYKMCTLAED